MNTEATDRTECPSETVTAWPSKGGRVAYCPWCRRKFHTTNREARNIHIPAHTPTNN